MSSRRSFFETMASLPLFASKSSAVKLKTPDYFKELGVKPFINAAGTYTTLTASLMSQETMDAMEYASKHFVNLMKLQDAVGAKIAGLCGSEAAMVTSGASGALTVGTAGCITGTDNKSILQLPDLTGLKNEVLVQKSHRYGYDHAVRACGVKMVEIETEEDFHRLAGPRTAMALFFNDNGAKGRIDAKGWERVVAVSEKDQDVGIYLKTRGQDAVEGLVVTVIENGKQAVLVNIVGDIRPEKLADLGEKLGIEPLKNLHQTSGKHAEKSRKPETSEDKK